MKITFLGGGNMASALIGGLVERGFDRADISVVDVDADARARVTSTFGVKAFDAPGADVFASDVWVLAVKPQHLRSALAPLVGQFQNALVISIAAGLRLMDIGRWLGGPDGPYTRLVRAMPNTPALIGAGVTGVYAQPAVDDAGRETAISILQAVGKTVWINDEAKLDAVTGISGSGPAYVFHFIEALEAAGRALGFDAASARELAIETTLGAAKLAASSEDSPAVLREKVTSKGGTTAAALAYLEEEGWLETVIDAVTAATVRSRELGEEFGQE